MNTLTFRPRPGTVDLWDIWTTWGPYCHKVATVPQNDIPAPILGYWDTLPCGCPAGIVRDEGHQEGCDLYR